MMIDNLLAFLYESINSILLDIVEMQSWDLQSSGQLLDSLLVGLLFL